MIIFIGHRLAFHRIAPGQNLREKYGMCAGLDAANDFAKNPAANVFLYNRHAFRKNAVIDVLQFVRVAAGTETKSTDYGARSIFRKNRNGKKPRLPNALVAEIVVIHADGNNIRIVGNLRDRIDNARGDLFTVLYTDGIHAVGESAENIISQTQIPLSKYFYAFLLVYRVTRGIARKTDMKS